MNLKIRRRTGHHGVPVEFQHARQWLLVAFDQVPDQRNVKCFRHRKDDAITLEQVFGGQEPAQRVVDMLVGACLVDQQVVTGKATVAQSPPRCQH